MGKVSVFLCTPLCILLVYIVHIDFMFVLFIFFVTSNSLSLLSVSCQKC